MVLTDMATRNKDKQKVREEEQRRLECRLWDRHSGGPEKGLRLHPKSYSHPAGDLAG